MERAGIGESSEFVEIIVSLNAGRTYNSFCSPHYGTYVNLHSNSEHSDQVRISTAPPTSSLQSSNDWAQRWQQFFPYTTI
jgi:hypothetical protein